MRYLILLSFCLAVLTSNCDCGEELASGERDASLDGSTHAAGCQLPGVDSRCGSSCTRDLDCGTTLYCGANGKCRADCVAGSSAGCSAGQACGAQGRCVTDPSPNADAGDPCPRVEVSVAPLIPTVMLLIDQSGSMTSNFGGQTRWNAVKSALTDPTNGVLMALQSKVRFGATLYTSKNGAPPCPLLQEEAPDLNNGSDIRALLNQNQPDTDTPTGESISAVVAKLQPYLGEGTESNGGPVAIVLATDGEPDSCAIPNPGNAEENRQTQKLSVDAAKSAFALGISTYILSVGSQVGAAHLQDMANAGVGVTSGQPNAPYYVATSPAALVEALNTIIRGTRTCTFKLSGSVVAGSEAEGEVTLNGSVLTYEDANGWSLKAPDTLELLGNACKTFKDNDVVSLSASFPCGTIIN
jgi:hypothetical protein